MTCAIGSGGNIGTGRFLDLHLYFTQALQRSDVRAVGMHLAMDLLHKKVCSLISVRLWNFKDGGS